MANTLILAGLETLINKTLPLDPVAEHRLTELDGKSVAVLTTNPSVKATLYIIENKIHIHQELDAKASALITGPVPALAKQMMSSEDFSIGGPVEVSGDMALVSELHNIARQLDLDWEEPLSGILGDPLAHQVGQVGRGLFRWAKQSTQHFFQEASTFIRDDAKTVANKEELNEFFDDIDTLSMDVDRLSQRIQQLQNKK